MSLPPLFNLSRRTHDADGYDFTHDDRRAIARVSTLPFASEEEILNRFYFTIEAAEMSRLLGGHYKCRYQAASVLLDCLLERGYRNPRGKTGRVRLTQDFVQPSVRNPNEER